MINFHRWSLNAFVLYPDGCVLLYVGTMHCACARSAWPSRASREFASAFGLDNAWADARPHKLFHGNFVNGCFVRHLHADALHSSIVDNTARPIIPPRSKTRSKEERKKVGVCVVSDCRLKTNARTLPANLSSPPRASARIIWRREEHRQCHAHVYDV